MAQKTWNRTWICLSEYNTVHNQNITEEDANNSVYIEYTGRAIKSSPYNLLLIVNGFVKKLAKIIRGATFWGAQ